MRTVGRTPRQDGCACRPEETGSNTLIPTYSIPWTAASPHTRFQSNPGTAGAGVPGAPALAGIRQGTGAASA